MTGFVDPNLGAGADRASAEVGLWFDRHLAAVHGYAARRVGSDLAADVVAETFRLAVERFDRFDPHQGEPRAWLFGIATRVLHRHWRTEERRLRLHARAVAAEVAPADALVDVDDGLDAARRYERLIDAVALLTPEDRDLLTLIAWEGMKSADVAAVLGIPAGTVRSRLARIRSHLIAGEADNTSTADKGVARHG